MSSTNRGRKREKYDYYRTPIFPIDSFIDNFMDVEYLYTDDIVLDPAAGGDSDSPIMPYPYILEQHGFTNIKTIDIRDDSKAELKVDYLTHKLDYEPFMIITNPPFGLSMEFIEKALDDVIDNGYVVMLLRLNFFGSVKRFPFFQRHMPKYCFVHHKRISFTPDNKTDSIEYGHFVWQKNNYPKFTKLMVI